MLIYSKANMPYVLVSEGAVSKFCTAYIEIFTVDNFLHMQDRLHSRKGAKIFVQHAFCTLWNIIPTNFTMYNYRILVTLSSFKLLFTCSHFEDNHVSLQTERKCS